MASSELDNGSESGHEGNIKLPKGSAALAQEGADELPRMPTEKESNDRGLGNQKLGGDDAAGDILDSVGKGGERQTDGSNVADSDEEGEISVSPTLSDEDAPPLPDEAPPGEDDGWEPVWDGNARAYYFYNRFTGLSQWENPRIPEATDAKSPSLRPTTTRPIAGGYNPAIHGDYDPNADYAKVYEKDRQAADAPGNSTLGADPNQPYTSTGAFNRFTGRWQASSLTPENFNDDNKARRQLNAYYDVDAVANSHDGRSLKAERSGKKLSKREVKAFKEKRRERKEEKRRAWLRD